MFRYQQPRQIKLLKLFINPLVGNEMNNSLSIISQSKHNPSVKQDALPRVLLPQTLEPGNQEVDVNQTIAVILPGRREFVSSPPYQRLGNVFAECGIKPEYIQPNWGLTSVAAITRDTERQIRAVVQPNQPIFGLGFSLGALCVLKSSEQVNFKASILCSMSFFSEEIPYMGALLRFFTKRVIYRGGEILQYPPVRPEHKYYFVYGQKELKKIPEGILTLRSNRFNDGQTIVAAKAGHNIGHHGYQATLASLVRNLAFNNQFELA